MRQDPTSRRIGNRRGICKTCNNWASAVRRLALSEMSRADPVAFERARRKVERDLYPQVYETWLADHPYAAPEQETLPQ